MSPSLRRALLILSTIVGSIASAPAAWGQESPPQTLEEVLRYAEVHAPSLRAQRARSRRAEGAQAEAAPTLPANPVVGFGAGPRLSAGDAGLDVEVSLQQQVEIAGEPRLRREAAAAGVEAAQGESAEVAWTLHVEVHRLYIDLLLAAERRALAERFVASAEALRDIARRQVAAGDASPLILLVADTEVAQLQEGRIEAGRLERTLQARLAALIGWPVEGAALRASGPLPSVVRPPPLGSLLALMADRHPALQARGRALEARRLELALEEREAWPEPVVGLSYAREASPGSGSTSHIGLLTLEVPLPLARQNRGARTRAAVEVEVAAREQEATAAQLRGELAQAAFTLDAAAERVELYATSVVPQVEEQLKRLERAFALGEIELHQVSITRLRLLEVSSRALDARVTYYETAATLEGLLGAEVWSVLESTP